MTGWFVYFNHKSTLRKLVEKKRALRALSAEVTLQGDSQKDTTQAQEIAKQQVLVQYLKVRNCCSFVLFVLSNAVLQNLNLLPFLYFSFVRVIRFITNSWFWCSTLKW